MEWDKMLAVGIPLLLAGAVVVRFTALGWLVAAVGAAIVNAALIGAAVRGPD